MVIATGADGKERLLHHSRTSHVTVVTRDKGFGTVTLDKQQEPIFRYSISKYDEESLVAGIVQSLRVLVAAGAVEVGTTQLDAERINVKGKFISSLFSLFFSEMCKLQVLNLEHFLEGFNLVFSPSKRGIILHLYYPWFLCEMIKTFEHYTSSKYEVYQTKTCIFQFKRWLAKLCYTN